MKKVWEKIVNFFKRLFYCKQVVVELNVERVTSTDRQYMFVKYGGDYRWFESCVLLKDYLDNDCDGSIEGISNVFQVVEDKGSSKDVFVVLAAHTPENTVYEEKQGFWVEDLPLNTEEVKFSYKQAFERLMASNYPKPHSRNCILRLPLGPNKCNPQYVFGNIEAQLWVDAITGEVRNSNPAFPKGFTMPLGEWP